MELLIQNDSGNPLPDSDELRALLNKAALAALASCGVETDVEISVAFVTPGEIRALNKKFRKIDRETDVLSFPADDFGEVPRLLGDIVICHDRAVAQANEYGHSIEREVAFLCVHSILHLLGYDHMLEDEEREMFTKQEQILKNIGLLRGN